MKLVRFIHDHFEVAGGVERNIINFTNELDELGYNVEILCFKTFYKDNPLVQDLRENIKIKHIGSNMLSKKLPLILYHIITCFRVFIYCLFNRNADLTISQKHYVDAVSIIANKLSFNKTKLMCISSSYIAVQKKTKPTIALSLSIKITSVLYKLADYICCISKIGVEDLKKNFNISPKQNIEVIHNPIITNNYYKTPRTKIINDWFNKKHKVIITCGRLFHEKNQSLLIKAFAKVQKKVASKLIIIGKGSLYNELSKLISNLSQESNILLMGEEINSAELKRYFANADLFVLPSQYEGFGNVVVEAIAEGLPVIVSKNVLAAYEINNFDKYHMIINDFEVEELQNSILKQINNLPDSKKRKEIIAQAQFFSSLKSTKKILKIANL